MRYRGSQFSSITKIRELLFNFLCFWLLLVFAHLSWKFSVSADALGHSFRLWGRDFTSQMYELSVQTAIMCSDLFHMIGVQLVPRDDLLVTETGFSVRIIWACTSVKQLYMFLFVMLLYDKTKPGKLVYIASGIVLLFLFNLIRIGLIAQWSAGNSEMFHVWHSFFQVAYYGLLFFLWLMWSEREQKKN